MKVAYRMDMQDNSALSLNASRLLVVSGYRSRVRAFRHGGVRVGSRPYLDNSTILHDCFHQKRTFKV